ncbi:Importin subunit beta-1, partial [Zancudomyces culisetae]
PTDYDLADFNNRLRCSIFEAYIGLVQGLKPFPSLINPHLSPQLPGLFTFMEIVANDFSNRSEDITLNILGLLGDVADAFPPQSIAPLLSSPWVSAIIRHGRSTTKGGSVRETARWAREMIRRVTS